jgi:hypothetical protein
MLCIHSDNSNKLGIIVDDLGVSDSKINSLVIKPMIVDTACLDNPKNSCLNDCVKPKSKVSSFLLVIILRMLVTLDQIVFC